MAIPIKTVSATEAVVRSLKQRISSGEFGPGDRLPSEQQMIKEYGVSRLTLREALAMLVALGIIHVQHGKGAFVAHNISVKALNDIMIPLFSNQDSKNLQELVEARKMIESEMTALAATRRTAEQMAQLEMLLDYDDETLEDPALFAERDQEFHLAIARICDNQFFLAMYQALDLQIRAFMLQYARSIEDRQKALDRHRPILQAIADGDTELARQLARAHAGVCASFVASFTE